MSIINRVARILVALTIAIAGLVFSGGNTTAQAAPAAPVPSIVGGIMLPMSTSASNSRCPRYTSKSATNERRIKLSRSLANNKHVCDITNKNDTYGVNLKVKGAWYKKNNARLNIKVAATGHAYEVHHHDNGDTTYVSATVEWAKVTGKATYWMDDQGTAHFNSVAAKRHTLTVEWNVVQTTRYWNSNIGSYAYDTSSFSVKLSIKIKQVTLVK